MLKSYIKAIEYYLPEHKEQNSLEDKLTSKIGIYSRSIAGNNEYSSDLAIKAASKLFQNNACKKEEIDFILLCTQSPDYILPTTACVIQHKLGLPTSCGALDFNLGCSGYVYGLSLAKGLIETGSARNVLLITSETYSKFINPNDRSVKVLFGDGAAATLISAIESDQEFIGPFVFGTDGGGANNLIVPAGGLREPLTTESFVETEDQFGNRRSNANLYMNGPEIFNFTLKSVPSAVEQLLLKSNKSKEDYDLFVFHQANKYMLEHLRKKIDIQSAKFLISMEHSGNTVSSTIPIALKNQIDIHGINANALIMLQGFGVGYSWAGCNIVWNKNYNNMEECI